MIWRCKYKPDIKTLGGQAASIDIISVARDGRCRLKKAWFPSLNRRKIVVVDAENSTECLVLVGRKKAWPARRRYV
jgi:hypothetical protein